MNAIAKGKITDMISAMTPEEMELVCDILPVPMMLESVARRSTANENKLAAIQEVLHDN